MSSMSDIHMEISDYLTNSEYTFEQIANKLNVPIEWVESIAEQIEEYNDSMDGDHDSAMASAGFGTDEDYGYYGDE